MKPLCAACLAVAAFVCAASVVWAQHPVGPPIPPDQVLRQQNRPLPTAPSVPVPARPSLRQSTANPPPPVAPRAKSSRGRAAECQHQATVERIPARQRNSYIHFCMNP